MPQTKLSAISKQLNDQIATSCDTSKLPGYVAGVYHKGEQVIVSHGSANIVTEAPMRDDTGFLFGSITKLLTTTLILQQVERGTIDLDAPVVKYLPAFELTSPGMAEKISVRNLLSHTNGIDADLFFLDARGPDAIKAFVSGLGEYCGSLFGAGEYISYSNGGMITAGRLLEVVTGIPYHDLLKHNVYNRVGMRNSSNSIEEAILRSTAVGHFPDMTTGATKRTDMFMLPESWEPAGSMAIGSISDLLAFARTHLNDGKSPIGEQLLSKESIVGMQTVSHDMKTPNIPPIGLGWVLMPFGEATVLSHSGASPGGIAVLAVVPEHDFAFAAYGNDPRAMALHDQTMLWLLQEYLNVEVPDLIPAPTPAKDLTPYIGTYRSNQLRVDVKLVDGQLEEQMTYEPIDNTQKDIFTKFSGGSLSAMPPRRFVSVGKDLFAPAGMPLQAFNGYSRQMLVSYHGIKEGHAYYRSSGGRMTTRRES